MTKKIAVVTGAGSGIGRAIATELAARDHTVVVTDLDLAAAEATAKELGGDASALALDVTDAAQAKSVAEAVAQRHGAIDVWVSNAGISKMQRFLDVTPEDLRRTLAVNLEGIFLCGQAAAAAMIAGGESGVIVNVASMAGKQGRVPYLADYVASKFGVVGLTQAMAFELAPARHHGQLGLPRLRRHPDADQGTRLGGRTPRHDRRQGQAAVRRRHPARPPGDARRTSPAPSPSWPARTPASSPARRWPSTAAPSWTDPH